MPAASSDSQKHFWRKFSSLASGALQPVCFCPGLLCRDSFLVCLHRKAEALEWHPAVWPTRNRKVIPCKGEPDIAPAQFLCSDRCPGVTMQMSGADGCCEICFLVIAAQREILLWFYNAGACLYVPFFLSVECVSGNFLPHMECRACALKLA